MTLRTLSNRLAPSELRNDLQAPLIGATLEAVFDAAVIGQTARPVILSLNGQPVASVIFDFSKLD